MIQHELFIISYSNINKFQIISVSLCISKSLYIFIGPPISHTSGLGIGWKDGLMVNLQPLSSCNIYWRGGEGLRVDNMISNSCSIIFIFQTKTYLDSIFMVSIYYLLLHSITFFMSSYCKGIVMMILMIRGHIDSSFRY